MNGHSTHQEMPGERTLYPSGDAWERITVQSYLDSLDASTGHTIELGPDLINSWATLINIEVFKS